MSRSGGMSQLLKGIIIGVVLILAIIGTMSMLEKDSPQPATNTNSSLGNNSANLNNNSQSNSQTANDIIAPSITLNPNKVNTTNNNNNGSNIGDLNAELVDEKVNNNDNSSTNTPPKLEGEKTKEEIAELASPIAYGIMELNSINPESKKSIKTNYSVFDKDNVKVAESKNTNKTSFRLATGQYKVETTLTRIDDATKKVIPVLTKSRYIIVRKNTTVKQTFELEPPTSTGILQVSAKINDQIARANFVIQRENGEIVATRNNVISSLFKLDTGTYKVSVDSGNNKDFRSVEVKAGESTQTVFVLKAAAQQGKLLVRIFDTRTSNAVRADITIKNSSGAIIQNLTAATKTELSLAPGDYTITVVGANGTSNKKIRVNPGQTLSEIFRFEAANPVVEEQNNQNQQNQSNSQTQNTGIQINENVTIKPVENTPSTDVTTDNKEDNKGSLRIIALDELTKKPLKSNFYIQTPNGKHLDKKVYADSADFKLPPGTYKVTVRATNRKNSVKTIRISSNESLNETFLLINPNKPQTQTSNSSTAQTIPAPKPSPVITPKQIPTGFLNVSMQGAPNQNLNTHFIVATNTGKKIVELTSVSSGNFKLDTGIYIVTAIHRNQRRNQRVTIKPNQNTRFAFNTRDFTPSASNQNPATNKGILKSRIIDETGRSVKGNLIVRNMAGQIVARANNVSSAVFELLPTRHTISVNYQDLSGSEIVNIDTNETTIQTFTIAQNPSDNQ